MANIPTIPGTQFVATQQIGTKINAAPRLAALGGVKQAAQAAAGAIGESAQAITAYEDKKRQAEEVAAFNQASIVMRSATSAYREQIAKNPDYNSYVPEWQKQASAIRDQILAYPSLKGMAKKQMARALDSWQAETNSEFQHASDVRGTTSRRTIATLAAEKAYQEGNFKGGDSAIDGAVKVGDMWPEQGLKLKASGKRTAELSQIETGIRVNPKALIDDIHAGHFKSVTAHQLETATTQARAQVARNQSDNLGNLLQELDANPMQMTDDRLKQEVKAGSITQRGADSIKAKRDRTNLKTASDDYNVLYMMIDRHDFTKDQVPEEAAKDFREEAAALPSNFQRELNHALTAKMNAAKNSAQRDEKPVETQMLNLMAEDREHAGAFVPLTNKDTTTGSLWWKKTTTEQMPFDGGLSTLRRMLMGSDTIAGMSKDQIEQMFGKGQTARSVLEAEQTQFAKQYNQMREWFKTPQGQKATFEQANAMRQQLEAPRKSAAAAVVLKRAEQRQNPTLSGDDQTALDWANSHPTDERSSQIWSTIIGKYGKHE